MLLQGKLQSGLTKECYIFGGLVMDHYNYVDKWPERSQDAFIEREKKVVGGCAVNMAVTIENLGAKAHVISGVGEDSTGAELVEYMKDNALSRKFVTTVGGDTGKCLVFLEPDGERTFLTSKGAEGRFTDEMDEAIRRAETPVAVAVTGYYLLGQDAEKIMRCLEFLSLKGSRILFDPSPLVGSIDREMLKRMIKISDIMTPNTEELKVITKVTTIDQFCLYGNGKTMIVKSGAKGGTVYQGREDGTFAFFDYMAEQCKAVDTTGAGDSFAGALVYAMVNDMKLKDAVMLAVKCAAKTVRIEGPHGFWRMEV